ncbi:MAG: hypothetical protein IPP86_04255 [Bacteroidetes bacterium]|nr:hypothetical protein [Bacteroidota bacterium]
MTFALLDFAEKHFHSFQELIVMETGGIEGRKGNGQKKKYMMFAKDLMYLQYIQNME